MDIEQIHLKTGAGIIITNHNDIIDVIREHLSEDLASIVATELTSRRVRDAQYIATLEDAQRESECIADGYMATLNDVMEIVEQLHKLMQTERLNRKQLQTACKQLYREIRNAL